MCHVICNLPLDQDEDDGNDRFGIAINVYFEVWHGNDRMAINLQCDICLVFSGTLGSPLIKPEDAEF